MRKELKELLDDGYQISQNYKENLYISEHLLLAILKSSTDQRKFLNGLGLTYEKVEKIVKEIYNGSKLMYPNQKLQVSNLVKDVINNDNTTNEALTRILNTEGMTKYIVSCVNPDIINKVNNLAQQGSQNYKSNFSSTNSSMPTNIGNLEHLLKKKVIGQDDIIDNIVKIIKRNAAGISDLNKPIGSVLCVGPTGVGKTELSKALAAACFSNSLIRLDMSEYQEKVSLTKLIGSAPGYVGYQEGGQLTEAIKKNPNSVVLFDEIEKAHPDIYSVLLQILDEGRLTDNKGNTVSFSKAFIILTSNVGAKVSKNGCEYKAALEKAFKPEFLNRFNYIAIFNNLTSNVIVRIAEKQLEEVITNIKSSKNISVKIDSNVLPYLFNRYHINTEYGAREIKRVVVDKIVDVLSDGIISGKTTPGSSARVIIDKGNISIL